MHRKLDFTLADASINCPTHRIMDLCDYLNVQVLEPMFARAGARWDRRFMDFFSFDNAGDPLEPTGTIRFTVPPLFAGQVTELESAIREELAKAGIKTGPFAYETGPAQHQVKMIRIPVIENPTALAAPPAVNMSHTRGCLVLRDLLGYQRVNGRYEFTADDLVQRLSSITEDKIAACTVSPVKVNEKVRHTPSPTSIKAIRRCLDEIRQFAVWAMNHNYRKLAAV